MTKQMTQEIYYQRVLKVLNFIEKNYHQEVTLKTLADLSCFSAFHFQRIFAAFTNESVYTHIKRLRLQKAVHLLLYSKKNITDIALEIGFASSSSFSKSFKQSFGLSPRSVRHQGYFQALENPLKPPIITCEEENMHVEIKECQEKSLFYLRMTGSYQEVPRLAWKTMVAFAEENNISLKEHQLIGYALDNSEVTDEEHLRFFIGITNLNKKPFDKFGVQTLAGGRYAVLTHHGHYNKINESFSKFFRGWLPKSGFSLRDVPAFVHYLEGDTPLCADMTNEEKERQKTHLYIPLE